MVGAAKEGDPGEREVATGVDAGELAQPGDVDQPVRGSASGYKTHCASSGIGVNNCTPHRVTQRAAGFCRRPLVALCADAVSDRVVLACSCSAFSSSCVPSTTRPLSRPTSIRTYARASARRSRSDLFGRSSRRRASGGDRAARAVHRSVRSATLAGVAGRDESPRPSTRSSRTVTTQEPDSAGRESRTTRCGRPASNRGGPHRAPCRGRMLGDGGWSNVSGGDELDG